MIPEAQVAAVDLDLDGLLLVALRGGAAQGGGQQQPAQRTALQRVDGEARPREQGVKLLRPLQLAAGIEPTIEDALASLQVAEQSLKGLRRFPRLWGQPLGPLPHPARILLDLAVAGVGDPHLLQHRIRPFGDGALPVACGWGISGSRFPYAE